MRIVFIISLLLAPALAAADDLTCDFDTECYDLESCADTDFSVDLFAHGEGGLLMSSIAGETVFEAGPGNESNRSYITTAPDGVVELITLTNAGTIRYTVHTLFDDGGYFLSMRGSCEIR